MNESSRLQFSQLVLMRQFLHYYPYTTNQSLDYLDALDVWWENYESESPMIPCEIYDPAFTEQDKYVLRRFDFTISRENIDCEYLCEKPTIFYMVHALPDFYKNLLRRNQVEGKLENVFMIGNGCGAPNVSWLQPTKDIEWSKTVLKSLQTLRPLQVKLSLPLCHDLDPFFCNTEYIPMIYTEVDDDASRRGRSITAMTTENPKEADEFSHDGIQ